MGTWTPGPGPTSGDDTFVGIDFHETADGGDGNDTLIGGNGNDTLIGGNGNDTLDGGDSAFPGGHDSVFGGVGDDILIARGDQQEFQEVFDGGDGNDTLSIFGSIGLETASLTSIERITFTPQPFSFLAITVQHAQSSFSNSLVVETLAPLPPFLTARIHISQEADTAVTLDLSNWTLIGPIDAELHGSSQNDTIVGTSAADTFFVGAGADSMTGGAGGDTYYVDDVGDVVTEAGANTGANDWVRTTLSSYTLGANVERLSLEGPVGVSGTGNALDNVLGADTSTGVSLSGLGGNDEIFGSSHDDTLDGGADDDMLNGNMGHDMLNGGDGNDTLQGFIGNDIINGGDGFDVAVMTGTFASLMLAGSPQDTGDGMDTLISIEGLAGYGTLEGNNDANTITGYGADVDNTQTLRGLGGNDTLVGADLSRDVLEGGESADILDGGSSGGALDFDTASYAGASAGVTVSLASPASNTGDAAGDTYIDIEALDGSAFDDVLTGDGGDNTLSGFGGADQLSGGDGNDVLYGHSADAPGLIEASVAFTGMSQPVAGAAAPSDPGFIYFVEKASGIIWRSNVATGERTSFLDIPQNEFTRDSERGALGLAFHPDYETNGRFFVFLTDPQGDLQVREYHRSAGDPTVADTTSTLVIEIPHPGESNHNGGWIGFSPTDGYLYISTGDGGGSGDPNNNAQNLNVLLGKMLRIDVDSGDAFPGDATRNFAIPAGNPFVGVTGADEIWAFGLRNPWRAAFDPRNGDLYIGDVGQSAREEVDFIASGDGGLNFGWRIMEGTLPFNPGPPGTPQPGDPSLIAPIFDYARSIGTTITGGEVYTGPNEGFIGQYVFADFGSGRLFSLSVVNGDAFHPTDRTSQITGATLSSIVDFVTDSAGALYAIGIGGTVWRLTPQNGAEDVGDTLDGGAGDDELHGGVGNDTLTGGAGADVLDGGHGADQMAGGADDDTYYVNSASDVVTEAGGGNDLVRSTVNYTLGADVERLILEGAGNINGVGNGLNNAITGNSGANTLAGAAGNDVLDGAAGADAMSGGGGDDLFFVDNTGDTVTEGASEGTDTVRSSVSFTLGANVENLTLSGSNIQGAGNALNNTIISSNGQNVLIGGDGNDILDGHNGRDVMSGGAGDDTYIAGFSSTVTESASEGTDTVIALVHYALSDNVEHLTISNANASNLNGLGNALNNTMRGNDGANVLNGGVGADTLLGGLGDDFYVVDNAGDVVNEGSASGGTDVVSASVTYTLVGGGYVDNLLLTGAAAINGTGNFLGNRIWGNSGANTLSGLGGNDVLDGGAGVDTMVGGLGNDYFYVENAGDVVTELSGEGTDTLQANITFALSANVENMVLGTSNDISATGNALNNRINGNVGSNTLDGGAGADQLIGGLGNDIYMIDNAGDTVSEGSAGGGTDLVISSITYTLVGTGYVEHISLSGGANLNATGNFADNNITGNAGANVLSGGAGLDRLDGGLGADTLTGGAHADSFIFRSAIGGGNVDAITDFNVVDDVILLSTGVFGVGAGTLAASAFVIGAAAADADDRIIYDSATGALYVDADGNGAGAAVQFATLSTGLALTNADFFGINP